MGSAPVIDSPSPHSASLPPPGAAVAEERRPALEVRRRGRGPAVVAADDLRLLVPLELAVLRRQRGSGSGTPVRARCPASRATRSVVGTVVLRFGASVRRSRGTGGSCSPWPTLRRRPRPRACPIRAARRRRRRSPARSSRRGTVPGRASSHAGGWPSFSRSRPVRMKPCASRCTSAADDIRARRRADEDEHRRARERRASHRSRRRRARWHSSRPLPRTAATRVCGSTSMFGVSSMRSTGSCDIAALKRRRHEAAS